MRWCPSYALWNLLPGFDRSRIQRGQSAAYTRKQMGHLEAFVFFAQERGVLRIDGVTPQLARLYATHLGRRAPALSVEARHRRLAALRAFCGWCVGLGLIAADPTAGLPGPRRRPGPERRPLSRGQLAALMNLPDLTTPGGLRDRSLLETAYSTGLRAAELAALGWNGVQTAAGVVAVRRGKGGRDRVVPIGVRALGWLEHWRRDGWMTFARRARTPSPLIWLGVRGGPLTGKRISGLVAGYLRRIGVPAGDGAAHLLRHSMATQLLESGAPVDAIAAILGHEGTRTTATYTHVSVSALADHLAQARGEA